MKYINLFKNHSSYEEKLNGGVDISLPNVSYCKDVKDVHYNPYNLIEFYVGDITTPETVNIYTDDNTYIPIQVSKGNKWYSYVLPKDKGLYRIFNLVVKKVVVKADINYEGGLFSFGKNFIPSSTVEASFKGSNTSKVTDMRYMFRECGSLTSLDVSNFDTSKVTNMSGMFCYCSSLTSLDVSNFDTSKVTIMDSMFANCSGLTSLNVSCFNTSNVTNMDGMFGSCCSLTSLDLSGWDMSNVTDMISMFYGCRKLSTITMKGCTPETINNIKEVKPSSATIVTE